MSSQLEDAFNEAVERRVADIRAHLLSQDTAEAMQLAIVNTHMEDKRPEMWASAAVYTSAALAVVSSALAASSADPLADENPEGGFEGLAAGEPRCAECVVNGWKNPHPAFSSQHRAWDDGRRLRAADPPASPDERLREAPDGATPTFCSRPDCGLRATGIAPDPNGVRWRPYCSDCLPAPPPPNDGWVPGCDDPEPRELGNIDTGEGWYET